MSTKETEFERPQTAVAHPLLAHEINNPLDSLLNLLYLTESEATPTGRHYLALAEEEVHRISQIAHGAMDRFRSPVGPQDTNVPRLLGSVVEFYMSRLDSQGIRVEARYCSAEDLPVDPGSLRQVFSNLLLNAAHAMPAGGRCTSECPGHSSGRDLRDTDCG